MSSLQYNIFRDMLDLDNLSMRELHAIPKKVLIIYYCTQIYRIFPRLSDTLKADPEIQGYLLCYQHHKSPTTIIRKDCDLCKSE